MFHFIWIWIDLLFFKSCFHFTGVLIKSVVWKLYFHFIEICNQNNVYRSLDWICHLKLMFPLHRNLDLVPGFEWSRFAATHSTSLALWPLTRTSCTGPTTSQSKVGQLYCDRSSSTSIKANLNSSTTERRLARKYN
jgi:hypothetical protein